MPKGVGYDQAQFVRLNNDRQLMKMAAPTTFVRLANDKRLDPQVPSKPKRIPPEKNAGLKRHQMIGELTAFNQQRTTKLAKRKAPTCERYKDGRKCTCKKTG